jgi:hypothetical protein
MTLAASLVALTAAAGPARDAPRGAAATAASWEVPKTFEAGQVLTPELETGEHHRVGHEVPVENYYYAFTLHTDFGDLKPVGLDLLHKRIEETRALEALNEVSKSGVFLKAAGRSFESMGTGVVRVVVDPVGTVTGLGSGLKRFGDNLGRKSKRAVQAATGDDEDDENEESTGEKVGSVANSALGVNKSARIWARKLEVDPYSRNPVLQKALLEIAKIDAAGGIAAKVAVPIPAVVSTTSSVGALVWGKDPEALRKANESGLEALGVSEEVATRFFKNQAFTLTDQTRFVSALAAVKAEGLADYVDAARHAESPRDALFFVESAEMLKRQHGDSPVTRVLEDSGAMIALSEGRGVALLPLDYVAWTEEVAQVLAEAAERAKGELGAKGLEMQITGAVSARAREELQALGWAVKEGAPGGSPSGR